MQEACAIVSRVILVLRLLGLESCANFLSQSLSIVMPGQSKVNYF